MSNQTNNESLLHALSNTGLRRNNNDFSTREFLLRYIYLLPWLVVCVGVALGIAHLRLRYINPVYNASGKVLIKTEKPAGTSASDRLVGEVVATTVNVRTMEDQIELVKSTAMGRLVLKYADLQQSYYYKGNVRNRLIHNAESPVRLRILSLNDSAAGFSFIVKTTPSENYFNINGSKDSVAFGSIFQLPQGSFLLEKKIGGFGLANEFICNWTPVDQIARSLAGGIQVGAVTKGSNVLNFVYYSEHPKVAEDVVNGFLKAYQEYSLQDKRESSISALNFIDDQLSNAKGDLSNVEGSLQNFKEENKVVALESQAQGFFTELQGSSQKINEQAIQERLIEYLINYVNEPRNAYRSIPLIGEVNQAGVGTIIGEYNKVQLQREISLQTIPKENPIIRDLELTMNKLRGEVVLSLGQLRDSYKALKESLQQAELQANNELRTMPRKQRQFLDITRQQKIMEELYSNLLQRKIQTSISAASTLSNIQVLEPGYSGGWPVSPVPRSFYMTALLIGLALPIGMGLLLEILNDKVNTKADIDKFTSAPLLGEVGHSDEDDVLIISGSDRKFISEQFRIIRANLQYVLPHKDKSTILVTSSMSGEGKSFVATNIAGVMAISGKKTVILEFDIRKPKILKGLGIDRKNHKGITNYLMGKASIDDIILPIESTGNLYVIGCGPIPPNPAELILDDKLEQLFREVKERFDVVVVDTAPVGLVSDAIELGKYSDASIYIVRHNYTFKKQVMLVEELYSGKKLPHLSIVINDVQAKMGYGKYYGYVSYGYIGYGYRSERYISHYFDTKGKKVSRLKKIGRMLGISS
jgi:tyrosine-protein kinase Etk/Wzc